MPTIHDMKVQLSLLPNAVNPRNAFRAVRNYLAGRFVGSTRDSALLDEVVKILFCKLKIDSTRKISNDVSSSDIELAKLVRDTFSGVRRDFPEIFDYGTEILLDPESIRVVLDFCSFDIFKAESDAVGDAFEVFVGSESKSREGQFFTPRMVTDLLVDVVNPLPNESVIDPACGAGGFLASTIRHHLANGLDRNALANASTNLYGVDKDSYLVNLAKIHVSLLSGGHPHLANADSISWQRADGSTLSEVPSSGFDVVLTNPPFGARIVSGSADTLSKFDLARKWKHNPNSSLWEATSVLKSNVPPQIVFVERCLKLLRNGGRMGLVLPESLLSNKSHRYVVQYLREHSEIIAVLGMPEDLFKTSGKGGTHTKTCLIVAQKHDTNAQPKTSVFMAEAKWCGHDSRARTIPNNDLPEISRNFHTWKLEGHLKHSTLGFALRTNEIRDHVLCPHYYDPKTDEELTLAKTHSNVLNIGALVESGLLTISTGDELGKLSYGTGPIPFIRTSDISNWEIKHDAKHGVSRDIYEKYRIKQDVRPLDILMVKDGTYLIGTCALVSEEDDELVYQSHIYKIRTHENNIGLTPYLLLAGLNSSVVKRQVRAKRFTMDIIDSLGDRIYELQVPIPRDKKICIEISKAVEEAFAARQAARRLILHAKTLVNGGAIQANYDLLNGG